jgi:hypothetical protein
VSDAGGEEAKSMSLQRANRFQSKIHMHGDIVAGSTDHPGLAEA